jgi:putative pyrroloquinoline-quinone binding quinoprotein
MTAPRTSPRTRAARTSVLPLLLALGACGGGGSSTSPPVSNPPPPPPVGSGTDVVTYKNDLARTGQNLTESVLTLANVASSSFGKLRLLAADGLVDAQPLYLSALMVGGSAHNVLFVATENDTVYAYDSDTGTVLWQKSLLGSGEMPSDDRGCGQVTPTIGITSTPVIDRSAGTHGVIYLVAMSIDASQTYHQRLHALDVTTGAEQFNGPAEIAAIYPAAAGGSNTFDAGSYEERAGLLLLSGVVYTTWTSHCDASPYTGWVIAYNSRTLAQTGVLNVAANSAGGGPSIWMAGGGPAADAAGNIYVLTANGVFDTQLDANGFPNQGDYGNSFVKIATTGGPLKVADYFAMYNEVSESSADVDLGSGGIMLLPDLADSSATTRHLAVGAGKDGNLYVVNRDSLGKFNPNNNAQIWQELTGALPGGIWSTPAYFNGTVYYGPVGAPLLAFKIANAMLAGSPSSQSAASFAYPGTSAAISANGSANGIVWAHENGTAAVLHAYDASNLAHELYNSAQAANGRDSFGAGNKFITPTIADGKVFVGTTSGVAVFGVL